MWKWIFLWHCFQNPCFTTWKQQFQKGLHPCLFSVQCCSWNIQGLGCARWEWPQFMRLVNFSETTKEGASKHMLLNYKPTLAMGFVYRWYVLVWECYYTLHCLYRFLRIAWHYMIERWPHVCKATDFPSYVKSNWWGCRRWKLRETLRKRRWASWGKRWLSCWNRRPTMVKVRAVNGIGEWMSRM